jgi:hypothetical protein
MPTKMIVRLRERASARLRSARAQRDNRHSTRLILLAALYQDQLLDLENCPHTALKRPAVPQGGTSRAAHEWPLHKF